MSATMAATLSGTAIRPTNKALSHPKRASNRRVITPRAALEAARYATPFDGFTFEPIREAQIRQVGHSTILLRNDSPKYPLLAL